MKNNGHYVADQETFDGGLVARGFSRKEQMRADNVSCPKSDELQALNRGTLAVPGDVDTRKLPMSARMNL